MKQENQNKRNKGQLIVRIMAAILAGLMMLAACGTLIFYLLSM